MARFTRSRRGTGLFLALILAGCAARVAWQKPGATPAQVARDAAVCRNYAATHGTGRYWSGSEPVFVPGFMPAPQNDVLAHQKYWLNQGLQQERLQDHCMQNLGYHLTPAGN